MGPHQPAPYLHPLLVDYAPSSPTSPGPMSAPSRRGAFLMSWSVAVRSMTGRRSSRFAMPSPPSNGPMTSSGSLPRCADPSLPFGDDALLTYRQYVDAEGTLRTRRLHPMHPVDREELDEDAQEVADALALLAKLHAGRNHRPIAQTITMLLEGVRAHAGIALWPTGEQALANCARVVDLARRFEPNASSFRAFVERMEADAERDEAGEAPIVEEGTEGVRMMTVHKAKGLEFPVVILADPTCSSRLAQSPADTSYRRASCGFNRSAAARRSNFWRRPGRSCSATAQKRCGLPMSQRPGRAIFWSCRSSVTNR